MSALAALTFTLMMLRAGPLLGQQRSAPRETNSFPASGTLKSLRKDGRAVIAHDSITNFMPAMTMAFALRDSNGIATLLPGDQITFRLWVTEDQSWIDEIKLKSRPPVVANSGSISNSAQAAFTITNIPEFSLTNEFGKPVSFRDFQGRAVALTFFFTRCPIPEYCPRLAKNFQGASAQLLADPNVSTNWHLLSISFDPADTPGMLRGYGRAYGYDSNHWSFLTGPPAQIKRLAQGFGMKVSAENGTFNHSFVTAVFDSKGRLIAKWPVSGDTTTTLVQALRDGMHATGDSHGD